MRLGELRWSDVKGEGSVSLGRDFRESDHVLKLDALIDWIAHLEQIYDRIFWEDPNPYRPWVDHNTHAEELAELVAAFHAREEERCGAVLSPPPEELS